MEVLEAAAGGTGWLMTSEESRAGSMHTIAVGLSAWEKGMRREGEGEGDAICTGVPLVSSAPAFPTALSVDVMAVKVRII